MRNKISKLLYDFVEKLNEELIVSSIKFTFNFFQEGRGFDFQLKEVYSTKIKINNQTINVNLYKIFSENGTDYDISLDDKSFYGYLTSPIRLKIKDIIENLEKFSEEFIEYPFLIQSLIKFCNLDNKIDSEKEKESEKSEENSSDWVIYFSSNI